MIEKNANSYPFNPLIVVKHATNSHLVNKKATQS